MKPPFLAALLAVLMPAIAGIAADETRSAPSGGIVCRIAFDDADELARWRIVGDRLMLGASDGAVVARDGIGEFRGTLRRRLGGAWCSARRPLDPPLELADDFRAVLSIQGDGNTYGFDLRDSDALDGIYWEATVAPPSGEWTEVTLAREDFRPLRRGAPAKPRAPLDLHSIKSVAFVIGEGQEGPYSLKVRETSFIADLRR